MQGPQKGEGCWLWKMTHAHTAGHPLGRCVNRSQKGINTHMTHIQLRIPMRCPAAGHCVTPVFHNHMDVPTGIGSHATRATSASAVASIGLLVVAVDASVCAGTPAGAGAGQ